LSTTGNGVLAIFHNKQVESGSEFFEKLCSVHVLYCASPGLTASTYSYKMKYQDTKVFITTLDPQIR
jgi:hypothetical protein